jgi:hypothetical protein
MLISRFNGVPRNFCQTQSTTLKKSEFRLRTALGDSQRSYTHNDNKPIHGTVQGSCASPAIWLHLSSFLMKILKTSGHGMTMEDVNNIKLKVKEIIEGFVDDASIFTNDQSENIIQLFQFLQQDGSKWAKLLEVSGGLLKLKKCF